MWPAVQKRGIRAIQSSTDNAIVRWDGTTGLFVQDSGILIDDSDNITDVNNLTMEGVFIQDVTNAEAFLIRQDGDAGDVFAINTSDGSGGGTQRIVKIRANGDTDITPTANARVIDMRIRMGGVGTNTTGARGTNFIFVGRNGMSASGTGGSGLRAQSAGFNWASTGTLAEGNGMNTTALVGGGNTITAGRVTLLSGNRIRVGFQGTPGGGDGNTPIGGLIDQAVGFDVLAPNDVSDGAGSHIITLLQGLRIEDQNIVDVGTSVAIDIEDQSGSGFAIRTGTGESYFGDHVSVRDGNELRWWDSGNSNYVGFEAPALTANQIWILPSADGSNGQALTTDGAGNLSWAFPSFTTIGTTRITSADSPYSVTSTDEEIFADTDGGAITINLPAGTDGRTMRIINTGSSSNDVTIAPNGAELLNGANASDVASDGEKYKLTYETTEGWW